MALCLLLCSSEPTVNMLYMYMYMVFIQAWKNQKLVMVCQLQSQKSTTTHPESDVLTRVVLNASRTYTPSIPPSVLTLQRKLNPTLHATSN